MTIKKLNFIFRPFYLIIIIIIIFAISCDSKQNFDSSKWKEKGIDWQMSDIRENMIEHLIKTDTLIKMKREEVIKILGRPQQSKTNQLEYLIREKYGRDIDPEYTSYLKIEFDSLDYVKICKVVK